MLHRQARRRTPLIVPGRPCSHSNEPISGNTSANRSSVFKDGSAGVSEPPVSGLCSETKLRAFGPFKLAIDG